MRAVDADIIAVQETWADADASQPVELADALGFHGRFAATTIPPAPEPPENADQANIQVGVGLISRWPIASARTVQMPARHRAAPVSLAATVQHPAGPLHVIVTCLEWEPSYKDDRMAQARFLADLATDPAFDGALPIVVAGDLNAAPGTPQLRPLTDVLLDTWVAGNGDPEAVTLSSTHPFAPMEAEELIDQRIDHILARPGESGQRLRIDRVWLAGDPIDGLDPSDHRAVVCDLRWLTPDSAPR